MTYEKLRGRSLRHRLQFLAGDSVLYGGAAAVNKLLSLFLVPILTRIFSPPEFGAMDALAVLSAVVILFLTMGQDSALARFYYEVEDVESRREVISQGLAIQLLLCLVVAVPLVLTADVIAASVGTPGFGGAARMIALAIPFTIIVQFCRNLLKWTFERRGFILLSVGATAAIVGLTIVFVVGLSQGVAGVFRALLIGNAMFAAVGVFLCRKWLRVPLSAQWVRPLVAFGWPYMAVGVVSAALPAFDRFFVTNMLGLEQMARYAVGYKLASLIALPVMAFQTAWGPFSLAIYREDDVKQTYDKALILYVSFVSIIVFALVAAAEPLLELFASSRYRSSSVVVLPIALGLLFESVSWITGIGIDLSKKTVRALMSYILGLAVAAAAIVVLHRGHGIAGVAWGVFLGRAAQATAYTVFAHSVYPLRLSWGRPAVLIVTTALFAYAAQLFSAGTVQQVLVRMALGGALVVMIWYVGITAEDRKYLRLRCSLHLARLGR